MHLVCEVITFLLLFVIILDGTVCGRNGGVIGWTEETDMGTEIGLEVDLRSERKEDRTIRFILAGRIQKCTVVGLPSKVRFGVWTILFFHLICLYFYYLLF